MREDRYFTFGQDHMTNYPLPRGGRICDYWVRVNLPRGSGSHRQMFVERFTKYHCPHQSQWAFEYTEGEFKPEFFPRGELCVVTETVISNG